MNPKAILVDTNVLLKLGTSINNLRGLGFKPYVTSKVLSERKNLLNSINRQMKENFYAGPLNGFTVIDAERLDIRKESEAIYQTYRLDSSRKRHSPEDADFSMIAAAKLTKIPIVSDDQRLRSVAQKEGVRAITTSTLQKIEKRLKKTKKQVEKAQEEPKESTTCLICGKKVKDLHRHLIEDHTLKREKERTKTATERPKQVTKSKLSKHRSDRLVLAETIKRETGEVVLIYRPVI